MDAVTKRMAEMAEARGLLRAGWSCHWVWDDARLSDALAALGVSGGVRFDMGEGDGAVWVGLHPAGRGVMRFAVSGAGAAGPVRHVATGAEAAQLRRIAPDRWVTWHQARADMRKAVASRRALAVGQWAGGVLVTGAVIGVVSEVDAVGQPCAVVVGGESVRVVAGSKWFAWGGEARRAGAAQLASEGRSLFGSYAGMLSAVTARAKSLIKQGRAQNDAEFPLAVSRRRRRRK